MEDFNVTARLSSFRQTIDNIDAALVHILAERFRCTEEVGILKAEYALPPTDKAREERQYARLRKLAADAGLDETFLENLMQFIIGKVVQRHGQIADEHQAKHAAKS